MSLPKIKNDLQLYSMQLNSVVTVCNNVVSALRRYNIVNSTEIITFCSDLKSTIMSTENMLNSLYSECSTELDIFFADLNSELLQQKTDNTEIQVVLSEIISKASELYFLYLIDYYKDKTGGILASNNGEEVKAFSGDIERYKDSISKLQSDLQKNNSKLIVKAR